MWITTHLYNKQQMLKKSPGTKLSKDHVINELSSIFNQYITDIHGAFLYGSTARQQNTEKSDIDILVIWKKRVPFFAKSLKEKLEKIFLKKVDFVCMIYVKKCMYDFDKNDFTQNECFLENVHRDAISIIGDKKDICYSRHVGKI